MLLFVLALWLGSPPEPAIELRPGATVRSELRRGEAERAYVLVGADGPVSIDARSLDFDVTLRVTEGEQGTARPLARDTDAGAGSNARVDWVARPGVRYRIEVRAAGGFDPFGEFELEARAGAAPTPEPDSTYWDAVDARARAAGRTAHVERALLGRAIVALQAKSWDAARRLAEDALRSVEQRAGPDDPDVAFALLVLGEARLERNETQEAVAAFERALAIRERALGPDDLLVADALYALANVARIAGLDGAVARLERAIAIVERELGPEAIELVDMLDSLGIALSSAGEYARSAELHRRALAIAEANGGPTARRLAPTLGNLAAALRNLGDAAGARAAAERALAICRLGDDRLAIGRAERDLASILEAQGEWAEAAEHFDQAVDLYQAGGASDEFALAITLNNLAVLALRMGDYAEAEPRFDGARELFERLGGPDDRRVAAPLSGLGLLAQYRGDLERARGLFERAIDVASKGYGEDHNWVADYRANLADVLRRMGSFDEGLEQARRAVTTYEARLGPDHPGIVWALSRQALLEDANGDHDEARRLLERGVQIRETQLGPDHPETARILVELARFRRATGEPVPALDAALRAELAVRAHLRETARYFPERPALRWAATRPPALDLALAIAADDPRSPTRVRSVADALVRSRGIVLDEAARRHRRVAFTTDPEVERLAAEFAEASTRLSALKLRGPGGTPAIWREKVEAARRERERVEAALGRASASFREEIEVERADLAAVERGLPPRAALLSFVLHGRPAQYLAFVIRAGRAPEAVPLGSAAAIDTTVVQFRRELALGWARPDRTHAASVDAARAAGSTLRRLIWDPVVRALDDVDRVLIVPDGELQLINFATLPAAEGGWFVERGPTVHLLSSERDVARAPRAGRRSDLLALGGPAFDDRESGPAPAAAPGAYRGPASGCATFQAQRFTPLPSAEIEARELAELWRVSNRAGDVVTLTRGAATEAALKQLAGRHGILHLATHAFFLGGSCSSLAGARGFGAPVVVDEPPTPVASGAESPFVLSGLALAGANRRSSARAQEEDGVLTAEEIATLDLGGVEWAVLSACDTGTGEVHAGEGVLGLRRSFQIAGARTVIASLWAVEDEWTRRFMHELYTAHFRNGRPTAEAMRAAAQRTLVARRDAGAGDHPFFWGAFVAVGDWR